MSDDPYRPRYAERRDADYYEPPSSIVTTAHLVYGLHSLAVVIGLVGAATVIGSFLFGIPSIVAVIVNYVRRPEARGTFVESHFR